MVWGLVVNAVLEPAHWAARNIVPGYRSVEGGVRAGICMAVGDSLGTAACLGWQAYTTYTSGAPEWRGMPGVPQGVPGVCASDVVSPPG
jgi:hypothetical protein